jgi:hypothetical protein
MKKTLKMMSMTAISLAFLGAVLLSTFAARASGRTSGMTSPANIQKSRNAVVTLEADASKVLAALEIGLDGRPLPAQAESKLSVMDQNRMRLLSQLSDRVLDPDHPTGSRLALFLMTMLILS